MTTPACWSPQRQCQVWHKHPTGIRRTEIKQSKTPSTEGLMGYNTKVTMHAHLNAQGQEHADPGGVHCQRTSRNHDLLQQKEQGNNLRSKAKKEARSQSPAEFNQNLKRRKEASQDHGRKAKNKSRQDPATSKLQSRSERGLPASADVTRA